MLYLVLISIFILFLINVLLIYFAKKVFSGSKNGNQEVNISIVIAAKNEDGNIVSLLDSLKKLDYPSDKYEVIIVDDNSSDSTLEKIILGKTFLKNLSVIELKKTNKTGKREALSLGIRNAKYPYILISDADCQPQINWVKACSQKFSLGYDVIFGIAPFYQRQNIVNKLSCFENLRSSFLALSMASIGLPYTATARNFGFSKNIFESLGGYSLTKDTISGDDDLLLREAIKNKLKIGVVTEAKSFVYSETKKTFKEYLNQKARHTQTSLYYLKKHQAVLGFWHTLNLFYLFSPLLMFSNVLFGIMLPVKLAVDYLVNAIVQKKLGYKFSFIELISFQIFYEILIVVHFLNASFSKIKWE